MSHPLGLRCGLFLKAIATLAFPVLVTTTGEAATSRPTTVGGKLNQVVPRQRMAAFAVRFLGIGGSLAHRNDLQVGWVYAGANPAIRGYDKAFWDRSVFTLYDPPRRSHVPVVSGSERWIAVPVTVGGPHVTSGRIYMNVRRKAINLGHDGASARIASSTALAACATSASTVGVLRGELVAMFAMGLGRLDTAAHVDQVGYWFQVLRVDARTVAALMVKFQAYRDSTKGQFIYNLVRQGGPHSSVAILGKLSGPYMATGFVHADVLGNDLRQRIVHGINRSSRVAPWQA